MWTAVGERISTQELFEKTPPGNPGSLSKAMRWATLCSGISWQWHVSVNRWSGRGWNGPLGLVSDAPGIFDHDGFSDLLHPPRPCLGLNNEELNSFFWRQVVANSPPRPKPSPGYEPGMELTNEPFVPTALGADTRAQRLLREQSRWNAVSDVVRRGRLGFPGRWAAFALPISIHERPSGSRSNEDRNAPQLRLNEERANLPPVDRLPSPGTKRQSRCHRSED